MMGWNGVSGGKAGATDWQTRAAPRSYFESLSMSGPTLGRGSMAWEGEVPICLGFLQ